MTFSSKFLATLTLYMNMLCQSRRVKTCEIDLPIFQSEEIPRLNRLNCKCVATGCASTPSPNSLLQFAPDFKVIVPKTYLKNPPTTSEVAKGQHRPVIVQQRVNILNIDRIDTVNMMFALTMEVSFEWKDPR